LSLQTKSKYSNFLECRGPQQLRWNGHCACNKGKISYIKIELFISTIDSFHIYSHTTSQVSAESASQFGELVADPETKELLHYTEKPETFVSIFLIREVVLLHVVHIYLLGVGYFVGE
jgi:hypothetical protein